MKLLIFLVTSFVLTSCAFAQTRSSIPAELVGEWSNGSVSSLEYLNRTTGGSTTAGGNGTALRIEANGTFTKAEMMKTGLYGCSTVAFGYQTGRFKAAGDTLDFKGETFYVSYKDSCNPHTDSEKNASPVNHQYQYELQTDDDGKPVLCLSEDGKTVCLRKKDSE